MKVSDIIPILFFLLILAALSPLTGKYMFRVFSDSPHPLKRLFGWLERSIYRITGVHPSAGQGWKAWTVSLLWFNLAGFVFLFLLQITLWLWFTVMFANFSEAIAEGRGKAQAESLRKNRTQTKARRLSGNREEVIPAFFGYSLKASNLPSAQNLSLPVLISLLVCLIPTTIGGLLTAIGISGMDRLLQRNVVSASGKAIEAAGDVDVLLLDKTGTITLGIGYRFGAS